MVKSQRFRQRVRLDRGITALYLGAGLAACAPNPPPVLVPEAAIPVAREEVLAWVAMTTPAGQHRHRFKWLFREERSSAGGSGSARIAGPDSLRFDIAGPFGSKRSAAMVVGDSAHWVDPPDAVKKLVPSYPLLWAMLGVARPPDSAAALRGVVSGGTTAWQYVLGPDTVDYALTAGRSGEPSTLSTEVREAGKVVGRAVTMLTAGGVPASARLAVPSVPARLDITFTSNTATDAFAPDIWTRPQP